MTELADRLQASLGDQYRIERELTGAGMSQLFVAEDVALGRRVVIKLLPSDLAATLNVERFRREVQVAAKLQHACIVPILSAGVSDGLPYYTMPFVEGQSLRERLAADGALPIPETVRILRDILGALSYAHEHGIVHRDIKPGNVMLTRHHALLVDFGIAKAVSESSKSDAALTSTGMIVGTPAYMAPEQAVADPTANHRADIYSVGALAYEMLTGKAMFSARSGMAMLAAHVLESPEPVSTKRQNVPSELERLVMTALAKDPSARPQSADEMLRLLDAIDVADRPPHAEPQPPARRSAARPIWIGAAAVALVVIAAIGALSWSRRSKEVAKEVVPEAGPTRIMIAGFRNETGDKSLDRIGLAATGRITQGLTESGIADVVMPSNSDPQARRLAVRSMTMDEMRASARDMQASRFVFGSYARHGDSLEFRTTLAATDGSSVPPIPPKTARVSDPMPAIDAIRTTIAAIVTGETEEMRQVSPGDVTPSLVAYLEFIKGMEAMDERKWTTAIAFFTRASKLDTSFVAPLIRARYAYISLDRCAQSDSLGEWLELRPSRISRFDGYLLAAMTAWCKGDHSGVYSATSRLVRMAPRDRLAISVAARGALQENRLHESLALLERLDPRARHGSWYYDVFCHVLHGLGRYDRELEFANAQRQRFATDLFAVRNQVRALAGLGKGSEVDSIVQATQSMSAQEKLTPAFVMRTAALELDAHGHRDDARRVGALLVRWLQGRSSSAKSDSQKVGDLALAYCVAGRCQDAALIAAKLNAVDSTDDYSIRLLGIAAARQGDTATANRALRQLETMPVLYPLGRITFAQATILSALDERQRAFDMLVASIREGMTFQEDINHAEFGLENLRNDQRFIGLLKAKD